MDSIDQRHALNGLIYSNAWSDIMVPALERRRQDLNKILIDPRRKRQDNYSDDFIRGAIAGLTWALRLPSSTLARIESEIIMNSTETPYTDLDEPTSLEN